METKPKTTDTRQQLVARIPKQLHHAFKAKTAANGESIAAVIEELIRAYLAECERA